MSPVPHRRRRFVLIYPQFQVRLILLVGLVLLVSNLILFYQSYTSQGYLANTGRDLGLMPTHPYFKYLESQREKMLLQFALVSVASIFASIMGVVYFSHRIAGPIVKLKGHLKRVIDKDPNVGELKFREGDYFLDLPELVNQALGAKKKG